MTSHRPPAPSPPARTAPGVVSQPVCASAPREGGSLAARACSTTPSSPGEPAASATSPPPAAAVPPLFPPFTPTVNVFSFRPSAMPSTPPRSSHGSRSSRSTATAQPTPPSSSSTTTTPQPTPSSSSTTTTPQPTPPSSSRFGDPSWSMSWPTAPAAFSPPLPPVQPQRRLHRPRGLSLRPLPPPPWARASSAPEAVPVAAELAAAPVPVLGAAELSTTPAPIHALPIHALPVVAAAGPAAPAIPVVPVVPVAPSVPEAAAAAAPSTVAPSTVEPPTVEPPTVAPAPAPAPAAPIAELPATPIDTPPSCEYDPRTEPMPRRPFFTPAVQNALRDGMRLAQEAVTAIEAVGVETITGDADLQRLLAEARRLQVYRSVQTRTIAVLGSSGKGKSHLINCLLHVPDLALTSDMGDACTSIVTEYRQKRPGQTAPFVVEVEYLSAAAIKEHVRELVRSYRRPYLMAGAGAGADEDGSIGGAASEPDAHIERESQGAWSALSTVFGDQPALTEAWLQDLADGAEEHIVATLQEWAEAIEWPGGGNSNSGGGGGGANIWTATAADAAACAAQTMRFMGDRHWPFTKTIRVYLAAPLLEAGIVLADLPGLEDVNLARMRATQDYLTRCDNILIVDHIARAIASESVRASVFLALARHVPAEWAASGGQKLNLAVVCTRSEDINLRAAAARFPDRARLDRLHAAIAAAKRAGDHATEAAKKQEEHILLVNARNDHVRQGLQKTYAAHMQSRRAPATPRGFAAAGPAAARAAAAATAGPSTPPPLDVFCVSNTWYEEACPDGNMAAVQASQIPALRHYCYAAAADDQLAEAKHYLRVRLPALLTALGLWATSAQARQRADATATHDPAVDLVGLLARTDELASAVTVGARAFSSSFRLLEDDLFAFFAHLRQTWTRKAAAESRKWMVRKGADRWHYLQYHAWCAHNGDHATPARRANWNASIIWAMRQDLEYQWELTLEQAADDFQAVLDRARDAVLPLKAAIARATASTQQHQDGATLERLIDLQLADLNARGNGLKRFFLGELQAIHRRTSDANCASYIVQDMAPVYHKALVDSVRLTGNARRDVEEATVQGHIEHGDPFSTIESALETALSGLVSNTEKKLQECLANTARTIQQHVRVVCRGLARRPPAEPPVPRDDALAARLVALVDEAKRLAAEHARLLGTIANV